MVRRVPASPPVAASHAPWGRCCASFCKLKRSQVGTKLLHRSREAQEVQGTESVMNGHLPALCLPILFKLCFFFEKSAGA